MAVVLVLLLSFLLHGALGEIICEQLPVEYCSFSVASSGKRCLLETTSGNGDETSSVKKQCQASEIVANGVSDWIETDICINACGVDRNANGISSDSLLDPLFASKLCSPQCYQKCPNIIDLFYNLAIGEGIDLSDLCKEQQKNERREMIQIQSSGGASGPVSAVAAAPWSSAALGPVPGQESSSAYPPAYNP